MEEGWSTWTTLQVCTLAIPLRNNAWRSASNMWLVFPGYDSSNIHEDEPDTDFDLWRLILTTFLAALDQTIGGSSLPILPDIFPLRSQSPQRRSWPLRWLWRFLFGIGDMSNQAMRLYNSSLVTGYFYLPASLLVGTALPTIVSELGVLFTKILLTLADRPLGGASGYSWVGTSYLLTSAACGPIYGVLSVRNSFFTDGILMNVQDMFGRKPTLFFAIITFLVGSALCGSAKSFLWLCIARGLQGIGGGGALQVSVEPAKWYPRLRYSSFVK